VVYFRVFDGRVRAGDVIRFMSTTPPISEESASFGCRQIRCGAIAGQAATHARNQPSDDNPLAETPSRSRSGPAPSPLPAFKEASPWYSLPSTPCGPHDYEELATALEKAETQRLRHPGLRRTPPCTGLGFAAAFLGCCILEVVQERLDQYGLSLDSDRPLGSLPHPDAPMASGGRPLTTLRSNPDPP